MDTSTRAKERFKPQPSPGKAGAGAHQVSRETGLGVPGMGVALCVPPPPTRVCVHMDVHACVLVCIHVHAHPCVCMSMTVHVYFQPSASHRDNVVSGWEKPLWRPDSLGIWPCFIPTLKIPHLHTLVSRLPLGNSS